MLMLTDVVRVRDASNITTSVTSIAALTQPARMTSAKTISCNTQAKRGPNLQNIKLIENGDKYRFSDVAVKIC